MHLKDDLLRAYIDREISSEQSQRIREHLSRCAGCLKRMEEMSAQAERVRSTMDRMLPAASEQPRPAKAAYTQWMGSQRQTSRMPGPNTKESNNRMNNKRPVLIFLSALTVIALVFSFTPARAWASDLLGLFRVQRVQVITFDPAALEEADGRLTANREVIERIFEEDLDIQDRGETVEVASAEEAAASVGFTPRVPTALENAKIAVQPGMDATFTLNQPKLQEVFDAVDAGVQLPESVHGKTVTVNVPDAVIFSSGCPVESDHRSADNCDLVIQMYSPEVNAPEELDIPQLGQAMFQFLGLSADEARDLSQRIDWTTTLVLPIPQNADIRYQEVEIDGVTGTLLQTDEDAMVVWVKDGVLYSARSADSAESALELAASLQ